MISEHKTASQEVREPRFANYRSVFCETSSALTLTVFNLFVRIIKRYSYIPLDAVLLSEQKIVSQEVRVLRFANYRSVFCETSSALTRTGNLFVYTIKNFLTFVQMDVHTCLKLRKQPELIYGVVYGRNIIARVTFPAGPMA